MSFIPNTDDDRKEMLSKCHVGHIDELLSSIPSKFKIKNPRNYPPSLSELEALSELSKLSNQNMHVGNTVSFLGAGAYDHYIPSAIDAITSRSEFLTSYTPYQAEVSQGTLQALYEFQTMIAELVGLDVANASLYSGATSLAESVLISVAIQGKGKVIVAGKCNPFNLRVVNSYSEKQDISIVETKCVAGATNIDDLRERLQNKDVAAVIVQQPNFYGVVENIRDLAEEAKKAEAFFIVSVDPSTLGILQPPGYFGADFVVGEGQVLGCHLNYGGPYLGIFAAKKALVRSMPGRLVGQTVDKKGKRGYVLTLQAREQHIRREKATSNICTNQTLLAIRAAIYLSLMGKQGLKEVGTLCTKKAGYLHNKLVSLPGVKLKFQAPFFKEFVVTLPIDTDDALLALNQKGYFGGLNLKEVGEEGLLIAVTEKRTKEEMDGYVDSLKCIIENT